jgi:hypothetical protein
MKRPLVPIIIILSLILSFSGLIPTAQATSLYPLFDLDQDGIPNSMENAGWYNLAGGPYLTDPHKADSDKDGLTDGEEKLFNTDPLDPKSPGIAVKYESAFKTIEYYSTTDPAYLAATQGGDQYLLTEALVVRRGTTFKIAAANSSPWTLTISGAGLTALTPVRDPARGGWKVTVPAGGTVGSYTATISDGVWSKSMGIYVIFELPTDLTQAQIDTYLYDDDPTNKRDEVAVWWRAMDWPYYNENSETFTPCLESDPICSEWQYHTNSGFAQAFWTEQYTRKALVTFTLPAIQGKTSQYTAAEAIAVKADQSVRVNFSSVKNSFSSATNYQYFPTGHEATPYRMDGGACETQAGVFTSLLRSAGIAARPFVMDYNKTEGHGEGGNFGVFEYDTAVMLWVKGPAVAANQWYAERTFTGAEDEWQSTPIWSAGTTGMRPLADVGIYSPSGNRFNKFQDYHADAIHAANEGWDWQNGSAGGGMVNTEWTGIDVPGAEFEWYNRDFKWDSRKPLQIQQSPYLDILNCQLWQADGWAPSEWYPMDDLRYASLPPGRDARQTYYLPVGIPSGPTDIENWPYNPKPTSCSPSTSQAACDDFIAAWQATCAALPGQDLSLRASTAGIQQVQPTVSNLNKSVQLGNILNSAGVDSNGDGRFDQMVVQFIVVSSQAGEFQLGGWLRAGDKWIRANPSRVSLTAGLQTQQITFDGQLIGDNQIDGPYQVEAIWVASSDQAVSVMALSEEMVAYQTYSYTSYPYRAKAFAVRAASIVRNFSHTGTDTNADGLFDSITISVPLNIAIPGTFKVEGDLYDGQGRFIGHAEWTGSGALALLEYAVAGTVPPYSLEHLNLEDANGKRLASFYAPVYKIEDLGSKLNLGNIVLGSGSAVLAPQSITPTNLFTATPVDLNANGRYDQLNIAATVNVTTGGSYWMEGLLIDDRSMPVSWSVSDPQTLTVGDNRTIEMTFDGRILFDQLPLVGSQEFTLVAVKIFSGSPGAATLEADVPVTEFATDAYSRTQFEPSGFPYTLFQDDLEAGVTKWSIVAPSQWSLSSNIWRSWTHAWVANGNLVNSGLLSLGAPLDLTDYSSPWLRFSTAYQFSGSDSVVLEVSTDGVQWTPLKNYQGTTTYWSTELVDLSAYGKTAGVRFRFNAQSHTGSIWYIDDVFVNAGPAINSASFTYPAPVVTLVNTTFTAAYVSIDHTLPMVYKWNFCGVAKEVSSPTVVHMFTAAGNCLVTLTVESGYDSVAAPSQTVSVSSSGLMINIYLPIVKK